MPLIREVPDIYKWANGIYHSRLLFTLDVCVPYGSSHGELIKRVHG
jgi:hypothetical protein